MATAWVWIVSAYNDRGGKDIRSVWESYQEAHAAMRGEATRCPLTLESFQIERSLESLRALPVLDEMYQAAVTERALLRKEVEWLRERLAVISTIATRRGKE